MELSVYSTVVTTVLDQTTSVIRTQAHVMKGVNLDITEKDAQFLAASTVLAKANPAIVILELVMRDATQVLVERNAMKVNLVVRPKIVDS